MARIDIPFNIKGQIIEQRPKVKIAAGGQNYFYAVFNLCGIWSNIDYKKAVFKHGDSSYMVDLVPSNNGDGMECLIPWEVMQEPGFFDTGIFGGSKLPTTMARTFVVEGCVGDGKDPQPPTPNWFNSMENRLGNSIARPTKAEVGQTIVVKSIDESGKPTEWEATDFPTPVEPLDIVDVYVCSDGEYTAGGSPTIAEPDENTVYLVPQDNEGTRYASWVYADGAWKFVEMLTVTLDETDGETGENGLSAYEVAVKNGFNGSEQEWLESLKGKDGQDGQPGKDGYTPVKGVDYFDGKDGKDGRDGQPGKDGTSPVVSVATITGGHRITITDKNGTKTVDVLDGKNGTDGKPGTDGSPGRDGSNGADGKDGNGIKSVVLNADYTLTLNLDDGTAYTTDSIRGATGTAGKDGTDGKTPIKGTDYYTQADKTEMVNLVLAAMPTWNGGSY